MTQSTIMIMAGGTGGHVVPALAVASELRQRGYQPVWLGTRKGIEARLVPQAGIEIEWIPVAGLRGKGPLALLLAPFRLLRALWSANRAFRRHRPAAALGMGGFASGPGGLVAWLRRIPLVLHEQNSIAGLTNRLLARLTPRVLAAFPQAFGAPVEASVVGNPIPAAVASLPAPASRFADRGDALRVLVLGGSQGARSLNRSVPAALAEIDAELEIRHQCGREQVDSVAAAYRERGLVAQVDAFIDDMADAYGWADIAICRAGAMTVFELAAAGLGAIFVPYPHAVDDHQAGNAAYLEQAGAALIIRDGELSPERLAAEFTGLASRERLLQMAERARKQALPQATLAVTEACVAAAGGAA